MKAPAGSAPVESTDGLRYFAAANTVVSVRTPFARVKICRIAFGKRDGSVYVAFPYLREKSGLLAGVEIDPEARTPHTFDLGRDGVRVSTDVKFSHHTSGVVQFSKTGGPTGLPRRASFPLTGPIGMLFQLHAYWLHGFTWQDAANPRDFLLPYEFREEHPLGIRLEGRWLRKRDIREHGFWVPGARGDHTGPTTESIHRPTGTRENVVFVGQPRGFPLREHVLVLTVAPVPVPQGADHPTMVFFGGFDQHELTPAHPTADIRGCLAFMYPAGPDGVPSQPA
jgi:hypothetical protein